MRGEGPPDFTELVLDACARLLALSDLGIDVDEGRRRAEAAVADGSALERLRALDPRAGRRPGSGVLPRGAGRARAWRRRAAGTSTRLGAIGVGHAALHLGAGPARRRTTRSTTPSASSAARSAATASRRATPLAEVHARDEAAASVGAAEVLAAYELGDEPPRERPILLDVVGIPA